MAGVQQRIPAPRSHSSVQATAFVGRRLIRRAPDVTRLLDRLERQGFIDRAWDTGNRRQSTARISDPSRAFSQAIDPELERLQQEVLAPLAREQAESLATALDQWRAEAGRP